VRFLLCLTLALGGCTRKPTRKELDLHPARQLETWGGVPQTPLEERIVHPVPDTILDYVRKDNVSQGYRERPRPARVDDDLLEDMRAALREMPAVAKRLVEAKLVSISPIEDLGGSAYVERVRRGADAEAAAWMLLDTSVLDRKANAWATWRENTPFVADPTYRIEATIEEPANDTRKNALRYILLHELGHVASFGSGALPNWWRPPENARTAKFDFFHLSWRARERKYVSVFDEAFPERAEVKYYVPKEKRVAASRAREIYEALAKTSFASLYGATNHQDDFAEGFVTFVHVVMQRRPFEIRLYQGDDPPETFRGCWDSPRCADKKAYFARLLGTTVR
jgi:hypothetical protein